jgi:hypothetical protein
MRFTERSETDVQACSDITGWDTVGAQFGCVPGSPHVDPCPNICKHGHIYTDGYGYACPDQYAYAYTD